MSNITDSQCALHLLNDKTAAIVKTVALAFLGLVAIASNILVLGVLVKNREMRTATNMFIANMAVSDLMFGLMVVPKEIALQLSNHVWLFGGGFGSFSCKFISFVQDTSTAVSIYSHISIAIERFYAVVFPLRARRSSTYLHIVVVVTIWVVSIGFHSIYFHLLKIQINEDGNYLCTKKWDKTFGEDEFEIDRNFYLVSFVSLYALPVLIIATLYSVLLYKLSGRQIVGNDFSIRSAREITQNRRVVRLAICIVTVFIIVWAPIHIVVLLGFFKWEWNFPCGFQNLFFIAFYFAWSSCFTNPLIYFIFSENYRNGLKNLVSSCFVIHHRIHPRPHMVETTEGVVTDSRTRSTRLTRIERSNEETVT